MNLKQENLVSVLLVLWRVGTREVRKGGWLQVSTNDESPRSYVRTVHHRYRYHTCASFITIYDIPFLCHLSSRSAPILILISSSLILILEFSLFPAPFFSTFFTSLSSPSLPFPSLPFPSLPFPSLHFTHSGYSEITSAAPRFWGKETPEVLPFLCLAWPGGPQHPIYD